MFFLPRMPRDYNEDEDPAARRRKKKRWVFIGYSTETPAVDQLRLHAKLMLALDQSGLVVNCWLFCCSYYAKLRQQEMERERELAEKYRDRARERRDGVNKDYEETELISTTANYRAVGPTAEAWVLLMLTMLTVLLTTSHCETSTAPAVNIRFISEINQRLRNVVSSSRSPSSWEVTWSTLTWWKVWTSLFCRRSDTGLIIKELISCFLVTIKAAWMSVFTCTCVCFRWELRSPVRRRRKKTWWRKSRKKQSKNSNTPTLVLD